MLCGNIAHQGWWCGQLLRGEGHTRVRGLLDNCLEQIFATLATGRLDLLNLVGKIERLARLGARLWQRATATKPVRTPADIRSA